MKLKFYFQNRIYQEDIPIIAHRVRTISFVLSSDNDAILPFTLEPESCDYICEFGFEYKIISPQQIYRIICGTTMTPE